MTNTKENKIVAEYYTPLKTRQPSELQQFKNSYKSFTQDKKPNIPKNINEVTQMRNRNFAIEYLNSTVNKKLTKTEFCKCKNISRNSLNMGLNSVGIKITCKTRTNENKREQSGTKYNKSEQLGTKERKSKIKSKKNIR
jgi:UDP-galactopyranose mutase